MPEENECETFSCLLDRYHDEWLKPYRDVKQRPALLKLWIDGTKDEVKAAKKGTPLSLGLPYELDPADPKSHNIKRGQNKSQTPILPPVDLIPQPNPKHDPTDTPWGALRFLGVEHSPRDVIIKLADDVWVQVICFYVNPWHSLTAINQIKLYTATLCTIYAADVFHNSVRKISSTVGAT